jgi:hypothetical protein
MMLEHSRQIFEKREYQISPKSVVGAELFHVDVRKNGETDRRTDRQYGSHKSLFAILRKHLKIIRSPTKCIYVFCVDLRTNSDYFTVQH